MKKLIAVFLAFILALSLCACGSSAKDTAVKADAYDSYSATDNSFPSTEALAEEAAPAEMSSMLDETALDGTTMVEGQTAPDLAQKIIYSAYADLETKKFDESISVMEELVTKYGGFIESSEISGRSYHAEYYNYSHNRSAYYVIRVPKENYLSMKSSLGMIGNVLDIRVNSDNITEQYTDVNSRLETYRTEEERLLAMLDMAENVEDMIAIEERLSEVRYNIESLTSRLRNWDNQVNYSTITISLQEVEEITPTEERTYGQRIVDGLEDVLVGIGNFFSNLLMYLIILLPVIFIIAIIVFVIILIIRASKKKKAKKKAAAIAAGTESITDETEKTEE